MESKKVHIDLQLTLSNLMKTVESEVPIHLTEKEEDLFSILLDTIGFSDLKSFLEDVEVFLKEEIDLKSISLSNVSDLNLNALAARFGKRYDLTSLANRIGNREIRKFYTLGWKTIRVIMVTVLKPKLQSLPHSDSERVVLTLQGFIESYSIIQGVDPNLVMNELKFWHIFGEYRLTLEPDSEVSNVSKQLPVDEYIVWSHRKISVEKAGEVLEQQGLIVNKNQWIEFFENHQTRIEVATGKLQNLVAVLFQMELHTFFSKNKRKGCWKVWQMILVDNSNNPFSRELRKISSKINRESTEKDKELYRTAKELIITLSKEN